MVDDEVDEFFLKHFGVKGMKWGKRSEGKPISRLASSHELKKNNKANDKRFKREARKDPARFKEEVDATRRRRGIGGKDFETEITKKGERLTNLTKGKFKDSQGRTVNEDFANAVVSKAHSKEANLRRVATGAGAVAGFLIARKYSTSTSVRAASTVAGATFANQLFSHEARGGTLVRDLSAGS